MNNENLQVMIERYKKQLLEFSQKNPVGSGDYFGEAIPTQLLQQTQNRNMNNSINGDAQRNIDMDMQRDMDMDMQRETDMDMQRDTDMDMRLHRDMADNRELFPCLPGVMDEDMVTQPSQPSPTAPTQPMMPTTPTQPMMPTTPTQPMMPTTPTQPMMPSTPTQPMRPTTPTQPMRPTTPTQPMMPTTPTQPMRPATPTQPMMPTTPTQPTPPSAPMMPAPFQREIIIGQRPYTGIEEEYEDFDEFLDENPGRGSLEVQVFAASRAFPLRDARVAVIKNIGGRAYAFYDTRTDLSGIASDMMLPTKSRTLSERPENVAPFTTYSVSVEHPDYVNTTMAIVTIFDRVKSILPVEMVPMSEGLQEPLAVTYDELINSTGNR